MVGRVGAKRGREGGGGGTANELVFRPDEQADKEPVLRAREPPHAQPPSQPGLGMRRKQK